MSTPKPGPIMTYEEVVAALREAKRLGDCVTEDIEGTARAIVNGRTARPYHVVVRDADGSVLDPTPLSIDVTIDALKTFARGPWGSKSDLIRQETEKAVAGLDPNDAPKAIGDWVRAHSQYAPDPVSETVSTPELMMARVVERGHCCVDADDAAVLVAAMAMSIGLEVQFMVVGFKPPPGLYTHVFARVKKPTGLWVAVDPIAGDKFDEMFERVTISKVFPIEETP